MNDKSCYYLCLVGCLPDKDECKKKHPEGCEGCDLYLEDPTPDTVVENKQHKTDDRSMRVWWNWNTLQT